MESLVSVNSQGKMLNPVMNYHQRDIYLEEGTLLDQAELILESIEPDVGRLSEGEETCKDTAHIAVVTGSVSEQPQKLLDVI